MGGAPSNSCDTQAHCADFRMTQLSQSRWEVCMGLNAESKGVLFEHECSAITSGALLLPMAVGCNACEKYTFKSNDDENNMICQEVDSGDYAYFGFGSGHDCIASDCDDFTLSGTVKTLKDTDPDGMYIPEYDRVTCGRGLDSDKCGVGNHVCKDTMSGYFRAPWFDFSHCLWGIQAPNAQSINALVSGPRNTAPKAPPGLVKVALSRDLTQEQIDALTDSINDNVGNSGLAQAMVDALHSDIAAFPKGNNGIGGGSGADPAKTNDEVRAPVLGDDNTLQYEEEGTTAHVSALMIVLAFIFGLLVGGLFIGLVIYCKYNRKLKGMISVAHAEDEGDDDEAVDIYTTTPKDTEVRLNA